MLVTSSMPTTIPIKVGTKKMLIKSKCRKTGQKEKFWCRHQTKLFFYISVRIFKLDFFSCHSFYHQNKCFFPPPPHHQLNIFPLNYRTKKISSKPQICSLLLLLLLFKAFGLYDCYTIPLKACNWFRFSYFKNLIHYE